MLNKALLFSILSFANGSFAQSTIKYIDAETALKDLKENGKESTYYGEANPEALVFLKCEYVNDIIPLYNDADHKYYYNQLKESNYCREDTTMIVCVDDAVKNFKDIFDNEKKRKLFLSDLESRDYDYPIRLGNPVYVSGNKAYITVYTSSVSTYKLTLSPNTVVYQICYITVH
jgi:hypothetical protein